MEGSGLVERKGPALPTGEAGKSLGSARGARGWSVWVTNPHPSVRARGKPLDTLDSNSEYTFETTSVTQSAAPTISPTSTASSTAPQAGPSAASPAASSAASPAAQSAASSVAPPAAQSAAQSAISPAASSVASAAAQSTAPPATVPLQAALQSPTAPLPAPSASAADTDITPIEREVQRHAKRARERACQKYSKQHTIKAFVPGDLVSLKVPREDRAATDSLRIFCRVLAMPHPNCYKLQTAYGVLSTHYPVSMLLRVPAAAATNIQIPSAETGITISLHQAAAKSSISERISVSCNCKPPKCSGRCGCLRNRVQCSVHCHASEFDCGNLSGLQDRTQIALVERPQRSGGVNEALGVDEAAGVEEVTGVDEAAGVEEDPGLSSLDESFPEPVGVGKKRKLARKFSTQSRGSQRVLRQRKK
ncbi:hypothetical protein FN846DRAFT_896549 [Sphaerosporella brunnea]|uniref:Uncharacterized protein n=1 Tax=Sphaerosporella brunnea TaxID=1250544 RepID=A0A5J5EC15_9PEZI|nr:hypothetical protein FN846DRAFT_896549 [Sphaerosporella brunnea]